MRKWAIAAVVLALVMAAVAFFVLRDIGKEPARPAVSTVVATNRFAKTVKVKLANRTLSATGFPERFCQHQTASSRGTASYVLALAEGASKIESLSAVRRCGARVIGPLPPNAFLVETSVFALGKLSVDGHFAAASEWLPEDKVDARLKPLLEAGGEAIDVTVVALASEDVDPLVAHAMTQGGEKVKGCLNGKSSVTLKLPRAVAAELAKRGDVRWLEPFSRPKLLNDKAVEPEAMNVRAVWDAHGLTGKGQLITTSDSGIDTGNLATMHADLKNRVLGFQSVDGCSAIDADGHGTHTAGSIVGDGTLSEGRIRGVAYGAKLWAWFCLARGGGICLPDHVDCLFRPFTVSNACIHSASWGCNDRGAYADQCATMDEYVWEHPGFLPVIANGNDGSSAKTVGSPATAKNVLAVGATQSLRSGNVAKIASFSSRGPCADGRIKPDLCSPGVSILSVRSTKETYGSASEDEYYAFCSGTSMATPLTAGAAALVRQWLVDRRGFTNDAPTAALVKAVLTGGAKGGAVPDNDFGWGRTDLGESLYPSNRAVRIVDRIAFGENSVSTFDVTLTNVAPFDVQLVWIDYPATAGASKTLVNDLDLIVSNRTNGAVWYGNGIAGGDHTNTVECVRLAEASTGEYVVVVRGYDVTYGSTQGGAAALYLRGAFEGEVEAEGVMSEDPEVAPGRVGRKIAVDSVNGDDSTATGDEEAPYATIDAAIAASDEGDVLRVAPGSYAGGIDVDTRRLRIESAEGPDRTFIDGGGTNYCFYALNCEGVVLSGFTLTNGYCFSDSDVFGAGAYGGTLTNCIVVDCHVRGNMSCGGGAADSTLVDCRVLNCSAEYLGGGLYSCVANGCFISGNVAGTTSPHSSGEGGGASACELNHCTVWNNAAARDGGGADCDCICRDSIVWGNFKLRYGSTSNWGTGYDYYYGESYDTEFANSCTTPTGFTDLGGNTSEDPQWMDAGNGDFRLMASSPCARTASDGMNMGAWQGEPVVGGLLTARVVGPGSVSPTSVFVPAGESAKFVFESNHPFVSLSTNGVPVTPAVEYVWPDVRGDGELVATFANTNFYVDAVSGDDASNGWSWAEAKRTIQAAVSVATDGETVFVASGSYPGPVASSSARIAIVASDGWEQTTIDGGGTNRCYDGSLNPSTVLSGFTLTNGLAERGGGAYRATLTNCVVVNCVSMKQGGGAYYSTLVNCTVRGCRAGALRSSASENAGGGVDCHCGCTNTILWGNLGPADCEDNWEVYNYVYRKNSWSPVVTNTCAPVFYWCCTVPYNPISTNSITDDPRFVSTNDFADARLYDISPCIGKGMDGANIGAYSGSGIVFPIPAISPDASAETVSNAVAAVPYADPGVAAGIGTNATTYIEFSTWATNGLASKDVILSTRAYDSFRVRELVSAPTLLGEGKTTKVELSALEPATDGTCSSVLRLVDGDNAVPLCSVKAAFASRTRVGFEPDALAAANPEQVATESVDDGRAVKLTITPPATWQYFLRFDIDRPSPGLLEF